MWIQIINFLSDLVQQHLHGLFSDDFLHLNISLSSQCLYFNANVCCTLTLPDLKDLRGAVQKDLCLFSCSQAASRPTWSAVNQKASQPRFRLLITNLHIYTSNYYLIIKHTFYFVVFK